MERKRRYSKWLYALLTILFVAFPLCLHYLEETPAAKYLAWLHSGINIGGTKVTIINIIYLILFFVVFVVVSRLIKNTLQHRVLPRTGLDIGSRASFINIVIYAFWILAIFTGINILGIDLSSLAFMAGALGIGIGFGLQNIVNNFVSGIILLFDPSIQVGDMLQLGEDWGTVSRINMRTTTVQTFENASLIIPNSQMLSNKITNWSFEDPTVRRQVDVGVAYGSDIQLVRKILLAIAEEMPEVLKDPAPRVDFMTFGDSALIFRIRFWISSPDYWLTAPSEVRFRIDEEFRKHGIEIAFPQQDIHIRSASGLDGVFAKEGYQPKLAPEKQ